MSIKVNVVSTSESIFSGTAEYVIAPGVLGELGIYPKHAPLITKIHSGRVRIKLVDQDEEVYLFVSGGILEVQPDLVTFLADTAIRSHDLDEARAIEAKQRAEDILRNQQADVDYAKVQAELIQAAAQLKMIEDLRAR